MLRFHFDPRDRSFPRHEREVARPGRFWLFTCRDSRGGGSCLVEAKDTTQALERYAEKTYASDGEDPTFYAVNDLEGPVLIVIWDSLERWNVRNEFDLLGYDDEIGFEPAHYDVLLVTDPKYHDVELPILTLVPTDRSHEDGFTFGNYYLKNITNNLYGSGCGLIFIQD